MAESTLDKTIMLWAVEAAAKDPELVKLAEAMDDHELAKALFEAMVALENLRQEAERRGL